RRPDEALEERRARARGRLAGRACVRHRAGHLPGEEPERPGPAQLSDQGEQPPRGVALDGRTRRWSPDEPYGGDLPDSLGGAAGLYRCALATLEDRAAGGEPGAGAPG